MSSVNVSLFILQSECFNQFLKSLIVSETSLLSRLYFWARLIVSIECAEFSLSRSPSIAPAAPASVVADEYALSSSNRRMAQSSCSEAASCFEMVIFIVGLLGIVE